MTEIPGSDKLGISRKISKAQLGKAIEALRTPSIRLRDWQPLGQPAPDILRGSLDVALADAPGVIGRLIGLNAEGMHPHLEIFPHGIILPDGNMLTDTIRVGFRIT